jgi:hypothetical protein
MVMTTMMMMTIFYRGTSTKSTENQNSKAKQEDDDDGRLRKTMVDDATAPTAHKPEQLKNKTPQTIKQNDTRPRQDKSDNQGRLHSLQATYWMKKTRKIDQEQEDATTETIDDNMTTIRTRTTMTRETRDGHGDLHQGRMEDDGNGGTPMPSATGTLDRKTSQASPATCFQPRPITNVTRSIPEIRRADAMTKLRRTDGCGRGATMTRTRTPRRKWRQRQLQEDGTDWKITDERIPWCWMTKVRLIVPSPLSADR